MRVWHDRSYIQEGDQELIQRGYAEEDLNSLRFRFTYTEAEIEANREFDRTHTSAERMADCARAAQMRSEVMAQIMAVIAENFKCYQYEDEKKFSFSDSGWDLFFWCNCFFNTLRGTGVSDRDYSYFTLSFNEKHTPAKRKELCDAVLELIQARFPNHPNLDIAIQYEVKKDDARIIAEASNIAPKLDGRKCVYHAKEGRITKIGDDFFFLKKRCRKYGYRLGVLDLLRLAWSMGLSTEVAS